MKEWEKKGVEDLLNSIESLSREALTLVNKEISSILGVFCFGSPQYVEYLKITLPYLLEYRQIDSDLYNRINEALQPVENNLSAPFKGDDGVYIHDSILDFLKTKAKEAAEEGNCDPGIPDRIRWTKDVLSNLTSDRKYLKLPVSLVFSNEAGTDRVVSMFQPVEKSKKPISITDPDTMKVKVIRKPFVDNSDIRYMLWRMLSIGILDVDEEGYVFLSKLGTEIANLFVIGWGKVDLREEEWVYIYSPFLITKIFEAHFGSLPVRRILTVLSEHGDSGTIFDIMQYYGPESDIENPTWPVWSVPEVLSSCKGKLDGKAKNYLYSDTAKDVQGFLDSLVHFGWVEEDTTELTHDNGLKVFKGTVPRYTLTDAGRMVLKLSERVPKTLVCLAENIKYPFSGYMLLRRAAVLQAIINGHESAFEISRFAADLGITEDEKIIDDVVEDLIRTGFNITKDEDNKYHVQSEMRISYNADLRDLRIDKPEFFVRKDLNRQSLPMIDRKHLILCDLADKKKIITKSRKNQVKLFSVWFADMMKNADFCCETFGDDKGPDIVIDNKEYVVYVSVEGAFDENPEIGVEKMIGEVSNPDAAFRKFLAPESRKLQPYYVYLVRNEETFQAKDEILSVIAKATGNDKGLVFGLNEMLRVFNDYMAADKKGSIRSIINHMYEQDPSRLHYGPR